MLRSVVSVWSGRARAGPALQINCRPAREIDVEGRVRPKVMALPRTRRFPAAFGTLTVAAAVPLAAAALAPVTLIIPAVVTTMLVSLAGLGAIGAKAEGAPMGPATMRVLFWGAAAMVITAGVGWLFGVSV